MARWLLAPAGSMAAGTRARWSRCDGRGLGLSRQFALRCNVLRTACRFSGARGRAYIGAALYWPGVGHAAWRPAGWNAARLFSMAVIRLRYESSWSGRSHTATTYIE